MSLGSSAKKQVDLDAQRRADEAARRAAEERRAEEARKLESARRAEDEARRRAEDEARARADQARRQEFLEQRERERQQEMAVASSARSMPSTAHYVSSIARAPLPTVRSPPRHPSLCLRCVVFARPPGSSPLSTQADTVLAERCRVSAILSSPVRHQHG